ncbi:MAG: hypothetical protein ACJ72H_24545 [Candidatus Sulfotelmatobacter sp.]
MLRLSIACAAQLFGASAKYVVCVNSLPANEAQERTGDLPVAVEWLETTHKDVPAVLRSYFDESVIEGMGWKLVPLRIYPERYELALDNDCIMWDIPDGMRCWLQSETGCLFAEDVDRCLGSFDALCPPGNLNAGIRGLAPGVDLGEALDDVLRELTGRSGERLQLVSEIEEQGLQAAAIFRLQPVFLVRTSEISLCSPFWPRSVEFGSCGAHFVGMNAQHIPWNYYDRPADVWLEEHWQRKRPMLYERAGLCETVPF